MDYDECKVWVVGFEDTDLVAVVVESAPKGSCEKEGAEVFVSVPECSPEGWNEERMP